MSQELENISNRLYEEYELTRREAEELNIEIEDVSEARKRLNELKAKIKGAFISPIYGWNHSHSLGCPVCTTPTVAEHIVDLHYWSHFQIHTEIRRKNGPVS